MIGWLSVALGAQPAPEALEQAWESHRNDLDAHARYPFRFDPEAWKQLAEGKVYRRRDKLDGTDRVLGVVYVPASRDATWVGIQDPHGSYVDGFTDEDLPGSTFDARVVYQRIALPWPLADRQWVILVKNNRALIEASGGAVWERSWDLSSERGAKAEKENAVWLPVNEGGWFAIEAEGGTLLGYHARTAIGGIVPDEMALRWSFSTVDGMLANLRERAAWAKGHYDARHDPLRRPDGTPIPPL